MTSFKIDDFCVQISEGHAPDVWGLVLVILWPAPRSLKEHYEKFGERVKAIDKKNAIYMYPFEALHSTVLTVSPFVPEACSLAFSDDPKIEEGRQLARKAWNEAWVEALSTVLQRVADDTIIEDAVRASCVLTYKEPTISPAAGFLHIGNPTGEIDRVRELVRDKLMGGGMCDLLKKAGYCPADFKIPNIRHATIFRYIRDPDPEFKAKFEALANEWVEHTVAYSPGEEGPRVCLVEEVKPYMHVKRSNCLATYRLPSAT